VKRSHPFAVPPASWVTSVAWLPDGRILSGGMDGALWVWAAAGGAAGRVLGGHAGPISQVEGGSGGVRGQE
jgi:WD40 repeat protein